MNIAVINRRLERILDELSREEPSALDVVRCHSRWIWRHVWHSWNRDLDDWIQADRERLRLEKSRVEDGRRVGPEGRWFKSHPVAKPPNDPYHGLQDFWRERVRRVASFLEFACLFAALAFPYSTDGEAAALAGAGVLVAAAWTLDGIKSKNRKWDPRTAVSMVGSFLQAEVSRRSKQGEAGGAGNAVH